MEKKILVFSGMIGVGKSTLTKIVSERLGFEKYFEEIDSPLLPLYYTATEEEQKETRYPFLLQLSFLNGRFKNYLEVEGSNKNIILDRSIFEDYYFAHTQLKSNKFSKEEFMTYNELYETMVDQINEMPSLLVHFVASFDTVMERIRKRGRAYEQSPETIEYFKKLYDGYEEYINTLKGKMPVLEIDVDREVIGNEEEITKIVEKIKAKI